MIGTLGGMAVNGLSSVGCEACCMKRWGLCNSDFSQDDEEALFGANCITGNWHYEEA